MSEQKPAIVDSLISRSAGAEPQRPPRSWSELEEEIGDAISRLQRELRTIKENDKDLVRQFLDIGTRIRLLQWGGAAAPARGRELLQTASERTDDDQRSLADRFDLLPPNNAAAEAPDERAEVSSAAQPLASGYMSLPRQLKLRCGLASAASGGATAAPGHCSPQPARLAVGANFPSIPEERG